MAIETDTERTVMLADFGVSASYTEYGEDAVSITVLFDHPYVGVDAGGSVTVENTHPTCLARTSDLGSVDHRATIVISGTTYNVVGVQPDGEGFTMLELEAQ